MSRSDSGESSPPRHIAVVMDGNGRWAKARFLPRTAGHKSGVKATRKLVENCVKLDIPVLTIFAFSSENWSRPVQEVDSLMSLFVTTLASEIKKLHEQNVRVRFIGDRGRFSEKLQQGITGAEQLTADNSGLNLNIAANYGGRWDILNAVHQLAEQGVDAAGVTEDELEHYLQLPDLPDVDLFIRTGGEQRISNFLIWQSAYAELYFTDVLWPDFDKRSLQDALDWYAGRERRFGKTSQQLESARDKARAG